MTQPGPSDYRTFQRTTAEERATGIMEEAKETAYELRDRAGGMAEELAAAIKDRPYTTLAITAGLAFAVGAVWKLGHRQPASRLQSLLAQLPQMPSRESLLGRWRS
jgi:phosphoserine phosphatase